MEKNTGKGSDRFPLQWGILPDIAELFQLGFRQREFEDEYVLHNEGADLNRLSDAITSFKGIVNRQIGVIDPDYNDMLRVAFMYSFNRGRLADLVSLLSGRDFETREFREDIVEESYQKLREGILAFVKEYNFAQFVLAIKGAGFQSGKLLNSKMTLDFAYMLYLKLLQDKTIPNGQVKHHVQKWFVLSTLPQNLYTDAIYAWDYDFRFAQYIGRCASYFSESIFKEQRH